MGSTIGVLFRVTTFGESHGPCVGAVVEGCLPRMPLTEADIQPYLDRRRPGQSGLTTPRQEADRCRILSGVEDGVTLGTPIAVEIANRDQRPGDYGEMVDIPRPSHADFTYMAKYGIRAKSGGGRASARETAARVAAGAIADKLLAETYGIDIVGWVSAVGSVEAPDLVPTVPTRARVDANAVRCPDADAAAAMESAILEARAANDSIGGVVTCICRNVPAGWGEPVFDKLEAALAGAMLSIPACRGFDVGSGFDGTRMRGSVHNDPFIMQDGRLRTATNRSGGIQGGISNGEPIVFRAAFKPAATIGVPQQTVDFQGNPVTFQAKGRHDPCVLPRAVPVVEAMAAVVLADMARRAG
jgi:chorismate synthase